MITYKLHNYVISFEEDIKYTTFESNKIYGITFDFGETTYELIHSLIGTRLLINRSKFGLSPEWKDLPLHSGTFHFLPKCIMITEEI